MLTTCLISSVRSNLFLLCIDSLENRSFNGSLTRYRHPIAMHHGAALTNPSDHSSPFAAHSPLPRRYDITGLGINLWLIHLHFIPGELEYSRGSARRRARSRSSSHKHPETRILLFSSYPCGPPFVLSPSRRFKSDLRHDRAPAPTDPATLAAPSLSRFQ